jgi:hypothetical protein
MELVEDFVALSQLPSPYMTQLWPVLTNQWLRYRK